MKESPIRLGSILFTVVEPRPGHEVAYNRWYERDHFYAGCLVGPGILAGKRWVATRPYKDLRFPAQSPIAPDRLSGSYLATYWIERSQSAEWGAWGAREVHRLHAENRMFAERDHVHTKMYAYRGGVFRDDDGVPPELALDHPYAGLVALVCEASGHEERKAALARFESEILPGVVGDGLPMALLFTPIPIPDDAPADIPRPAEDARRFLVILFCERDPADVWPSISKLDGRDEILWASPFIPTIPGTDTYTDQLR